MRKSKFTKIICTAFAVISAATLAVAPACSTSFKGVTGDKDTATQAVAGANGGFVTETENFVYFINGKTANTDENNFGSVLKGSVQRISKSDLNAGNYANTQTVVPSVMYSGTYNAGLYIYGGYIYYTTPTTERNSDGEILNSNLDFKRTKLDGTDTTKGYIWQSADNGVDYRFVEVDGTVYIIYALSENLYGEDSASAVNVHSVNCTTGENIVLAYNVSSYAFDTEDAENPYIYYTMDVPQYFGGSKLGYNQLYRVRADVKESPREYDFSDVEDYDPEKDPVYINYGDYVFDGIGSVNHDTENRVTQLNFAHYSGKNYSLINGDYTYSIKWYKNGTLYYTRTSGENVQFYSLTNEQLGVADGKVSASWDAVEKNAEQTAILSEDVSTDYIYVELDDGKLYAIEANSNGVKRYEVDGGALKNEVSVCSDNVNMSIELKKENGHRYLYYGVTSGNGMSVNRVAIDGAATDYRGILSSLDSTYKSITILDFAVSLGSSWYMPEFVNNKLLFASETENMTDYNYIMVCDLQSQANAGSIMTNEELEALYDKMNGVKEKIATYNEEENADGTAYYDGLSDALTYLFITGDADYIDVLNKAYVDIEDREEYYAYSEDSVKIYKDFAATEGDWEKNEEGDTPVDYKTDIKKINGKDVHSNSLDYYYTVIGRMTEDDAQNYKDAFKSYMKDYPVDDSTWWEKLSTGGKVGFIIGMVAAGLVVIAGVTVAVVIIVKRKKKGGEDNKEEKIKVDITDDKSVDVYGNGEEGSSDGVENVVSKDENGVTDGE